MYFSASETLNVPMAKQEQAEKAAKAGGLANPEVACLPTGSMAFIFGGGTESTRDQKSVREYDAMVQQDYELLEELD